jgi:hypothetical protein
LPTTAAIGDDGHSRRRPVFPLRGDGASDAPGGEPVVRTLLLPLALACAAPMAVAQPFPAKPVRIIVGFAPGGGTDFVARVLGQRLGEVWGQQVLVENRAGAAGTIGADFVAKAPGDGYTLLMGHVNSNAIAPNVFRRMPYDTLKDLSMVLYVGYVPNVLVLHPSLPAKSVKELIALARSKPGALTFASSGTSSSATDMASGRAGRSFCRSLSCFSRSPSCVLSLAALGDSLEATVLLSTAPTGRNCTASVMTVPVVPALLTTTMASWAAKSN